MVKSAASALVESNVDWTDKESVMPTGEQLPIHTCLLLTADLEAVRGNVHRKMQLLEEKTSGLNAIADKVEKAHDKHGEEERQKYDAKRATREAMEQLQTDFSHTLQGYRTAIDNLLQDNKRLRTTIEKLRIGSASGEEQKKSA